MLSTSWWRWWNRSVSGLAAPPPARSLSRPRCPRSRSPSWKRCWPRGSTTAWAGCCSPPLWTCWSEWSARRRRPRAELRSTLHPSTATCRRTAGCCTRRRYGGNISVLVSTFLVLINCPLQVKYMKIYLRDTTLIPPFPMLLFGGDIDVQHRERLITLDGWIHFQVGGHWSSPGARDINDRLTLIQYCVLRLLFGSASSSSTWGN